MKMLFQRIGWKYSTPQEKAKEIFYATLVSLFIAGGVWLSNNIKSEEKQKQEDWKKQEVRAQEFTKFLIQDVNDWVKSSDFKKDISYAVDEYKKNPKKYDKYIQELMQDSAKYADALLRDARFVINSNEMKTASFVEAKKHIESQQSVVEVNETRKVARQRMGVSHGEEVVAGIDYYEEPTGRKISVPNKSPARVMKINSGHLKDKTKKLAILRAAKQKY
jgi:hypothetical protein